MMKPKTRPLTAPDWGATRWLPLVIVVAGLLGFGLPATASFPERTATPLGLGGFPGRADVDKLLVAPGPAVAGRDQLLCDGMLVIQEPPTPRGIGASTPRHVSVGWRCSGLSVAGYGGPRRDGNNIPTVSYTRGQDLGGGRQTAGGVGGLLALTQPSGFSPQHFYYHSDGNGNVTSLLDSHQTVVARYQYDPFGNLLGLSGTMADANLYRFSSKEFHQNSGLYYYGFRFYEPGLQRWINADPIEEDGGLNLYGFVSNDPTDLLDLYGLDWWDDWQDWSEGASEAFYGALAGLDPSGMLPIDPDNPNMQGGQYVGLAAGMCLGGEGEIKAGVAAGKALAKKALSACKGARKAAKAAEAEGKAFTRAQKRKILDANRARNKGRLRSDLSGEELVPARKSQKGVTPPANETQIDHVFPRSKGGPNTADNAQVLSREENRIKSDKIE